MTYRISLATLLAVLLLGCGGDDGAPSSEARPSAVTTKDGGPLGTVQFPTSCDGEAQDELERGLALLHHMTYEESRESFRTAAEADPECAIAYWGHAMTLVHPLWPDTVSGEALAEGRELLETAREAQHASAREDAYIEALAGYFGPATESERLKAFLEGWEAVHRDHPDDPEAALFFALAQLSTAPASDKTYANQKAAGAIAEGILERLPDHPGAHHYLIHAYDFPPLAERALETARHYDEVAPENSHALHMTSHIFTRLGLWSESIEFNERAAAAARDRLASGAISIHHLHALDYLAYAHLQRADDDAARQVLQHLRELEPPYQDHAGVAYAFAAVPVRHALERHAWREASEVEARWPAEVSWDAYPHLEAIPRFAGALGSVHTERPDAASEAIETLTRLEEEARALDSAYDWGTQVAIQRTGAEAWLAYETGEAEKGLELMKEAAEMEAGTEKNPVTPSEVLPAMELYGDMLLDAGRYDEARARYEAALERSPNRFNSLYGAGRAAELAGDESTALGFYRQLIEITVEDAEREELAHAREYIASKQPT